MFWLILVGLLVLAVLLIGWMHAHDGPRTCLLCGRTLPPISWRQSMFGHPSPSCMGQRRPECWVLLHKRMGIEPAPPYPYRVGP